jgi:hypothetical protein
MNGLSGGASRMLNGGMRGLPVRAETYLRFWR